MSATAITNGTMNFVSYQNGATKQVSGHMTYDLPPFPLPSPSCPCPHSHNGYHWLCLHEGLGVYSKRRRVRELHL